MKKVLNYCKHIVLAAAVALTVLTLGKTSVKAGDIQMGNLTVGVEQTITLSGNNNFYYHFTTPNSGTFRVNIVLAEKKYTKTGETVSYGDTYVKLNCDYRDIWSSYIYLDRGVYHSSEFSFGKGKDVTLRINDQASDYTYTYKILVENIKYTRFEKEPNNTANSATKLTNNKTYTGVANKENTDWFVFKAPRTGRYKVTVVNTDPEDYGDFYCACYKTRNKLDYGKSQYIYQGRGWQKFGTIKLKKGRSYYVKISNPSREGIHYQLKIKKLR